jgi:hypothetical protein
MQATPTLIVIPMGPMTTTIITVQIIITHMHPINTSPHLIAIMTTLFISQVSNLTISITVMPVIPFLQITIMVLAYLIQVMLPFLNLIKKPMI